MRKILVVFLSVLFGCIQPLHAAPLPVVASFSILGDMVRTVGGDAVAVTVLVGPDGDAHSFQPTAQDARALAAASLIFVNGLGFEGWMEKLAETSGAKSRMVVASEGVRARIANEEGHGDHDHGDTDPHAWQDLANGRIYVNNIAAALMAALPQQAGAIRARARDYDQRLKQLDEQIKHDFAAIPVAQRRVITSHDAFGYFGAAYDVAFMAPEGLSTETEPSAAAVARLTDQIKREGIKTVFVENMTNSRLIKQLAEDTGAKIGGTLYSDALSGPDGSAPTYLGMFRNNVPKLKRAMQENASMPAD
ncbi:MAG: metal ABC transporter substrate-binding protein [Alphaproteobacteria bacterium]|nr:metal ABC transporter substrate-binding protein [Alphaproteobacteria bacterium]